MFYKVLIRMSSRSQGHPSINKKRISEQSLKLSDGQNVLLIDVENPSYILLSTFVQQDGHSPSLSCLRVALPTIEFEKADSYDRTRCMVDCVHRHVCDLESFSDI